VRGAGGGGGGKAGRPTLDTIREKIESKLPRDVSCWGPQDKPAAGAQSRTCLSWDKIKWKPQNRSTTWGKATAKN